MFTQLLTETVLGALTGYITNDTAIRSLFKPNGIIEQTRDDFAREAGQLLESQVLTLAVLQHQLMLPEVQETLKSALHQFMHKALPDAFGDLSVKELPEHETAVQYLQEVLLHFLTAEREEILYFLRNYFSVDALLTPEQSEKFASTLETVLLDTLEQEQFAERIWQGWSQENGNSTLEELELASFCDAAAGNLARYSARWLEELQQQYGAQLKEAALQSIHKLHLETILLELDKQMETYTLRQYLNCDAGELTLALQQLLNSAQGKQLIDVITAEVLRALQTVEIPIQQLMPADLLDDFVPLLRQEFPAVLEEVMAWVWQNKQSVQRMLEETVDEIAAETGGMKGMLLEQLKDTLLGELMQSSDTYRTILEVLVSEDTADQTVDYLMEKLTAVLTENTVGQLITLLNQNGKLHRMAQQFLYENAMRYLNQSGSAQMEQLLDWCPGSLQLSAHKEEVEALLVQVLLLAVKQMDVSVWIQNGCEAIKTMPVVRLFPNHEADPADTFAQLVQKLIHGACAYAADTLPKSQSNTVYSTLYDTILWWIETYGAPWMEQTCGNVKLSDLLQSMSGRLDSHTVQMADGLSQAGLQVMQGRLSVLAEEQIQALSSEEMLELVEDFMGRELQPLNYLGAGMGAAAGATVGMALSTAVPEVSLTAPALAAGVLAGKTAVFGAVGYTTNCAAVKGLFWPYEPVAGIRTIQGVIPKQKERFAGSMGRLVERYVINDEILGQQIKQLHDYAQEQNTAKALASNAQLFERIFAELAMERRQLTAPLCHALTDIGTKQSRERLLQLGDQPLTFFSDSLPKGSTEEKDTAVLQKLSVWLTAQLHKDIPLDALFQAEELWQWLTDAVPQLPLPDFAGMAQDLLGSEKTLLQLLGDDSVSAKDALQNQIADYLSEQKQQDKLAAGIGNLLSGEKLYHWLVHNSDAWVEDNLTMLFHWVEGLILELMQSRQDLLTEAIEQELLNRMGLMMQMGYAMMNGGEIVAAIVDRLLHQKLPIFLSVKRRELETMLYQIWENQLSPAMRAFAAPYLQEDAALLYTALRTLLAEPAVQHCAVRVCSDVVQIAAEQPIKRWGQYLNVQDLLARPQMQFGFQWQTHSKEVLACWQNPLQSFLQEQLSHITLAQLCRGYQDIFPLYRIADCTEVYAMMDDILQHFSETLSGTTLNDWLQWDMAAEVLSDDIAALLAQEHFQQWMQYEAELLVLALAEAPDKLLPVDTRMVLIDCVMQAVFVTAGEYGTALLGRMQLSTLAEEQLKQMDSAHLELVVRGFAQHYLVHIQNRGWLGAVFAIPGMLLYLIG